MRLIDAEELKEDLTKWFPQFTLEGIEPKTLFAQIMRDIDNAPTVETPTIYEFKGCDNCELDRPKGEWVVTAEDNDGVHRICCPFCSYEKGSNNIDPIIVTFTNFPKFCENCGADMRGGAES